MANSTLERFNFKVKVEAAGQTGFSVLEAPMGEGYVQRAADGINNRTDQWNLTARGLWLDVEPGACRFAGQDVKGIVKFIEDHGGVRAFAWTAPDGTDAMWVCKAVSKTKDTPLIMSLSFTFTRTYVP